jgi:hypothetical protein
MEDAELPSNTPGVETHSAQDGTGAVLQPYTKALNKLLIVGTQNSHAARRSLKRSLKRSSNAEEDSN